MSNLCFIILHNLFLQSIFLSIYQPIYPSIYHRYLPFNNFFFRIQIPESWSLNPMKLTNKLYRIDMQQTVPLILTSQGNNLNQVFQSKLNLGARKRLLMVGQGVGTKLRYRSGLKKSRILVKCHRGWNRSAPRFQPRWHFGRFWPPRRPPQFGDLWMQFAQPHAISSVDEDAAPRLSFDWKIGLLLFNRPVLGGNWKLFF